VTIHRNAKLAPNGGLAMSRRLEEGWSVGRVARAFHVSETTVRKWHRRYREERLSGLCDRSSRPRGRWRPVARRGSSPLACAQGLANPEGHGHVFF
jgi:hypothetical protein